MTTDPETAPNSPDVAGCAAMPCSIFRVPSSIAVCPECGEYLEGEIDGGDETSVDVTVWCPTYLGEEGEEDSHRVFQSDWQDVIDRVTEWVNKSNGGDHLQGAEEGAK